MSEANWMEMIKARYPYRRVSFWGGDAFVTNEWNERVVVGYWESEDCWG